MSTLGAVAEARGQRIADVLRTAVGSVLDVPQADVLVAEVSRARRAGWRAPRRERPRVFDLAEWRRRRTFGGEEWVEIPRWES